MLLLSIFDWPTPTFFAAIVAAVRCYAMLLCRRFAFFMLFAALMPRLRYALLRRRRYAQIVREVSGAAKCGMAAIRCRYIQAARAARVRSRVSAMRRARGEDGDGAAA